MADEDYSHSLDKPLVQIGVKEVGKQLAIKDKSI